MTDTIVVALERPGPDNRTGRFRLSVGGPGSSSEEIGKAVAVAVAVAGVGVGVGAAVRARVEGWSGPRDFRGSCVISPSLASAERDGCGMLEITCVHTPGPVPAWRSSLREAVMDVTGPIRVVVAKPGLDGHDRGAKVIARALRDAGMEVIYTGLHQTPEQVVDTAIQEDANAIGLSILSGAHNTLFARVLELLRERDATDIKVFGGGIIPEDDIPLLKEQGVAEIFTPGATTTEVVDWIRTHVGPVAA